MNAIENKNVNGLLVGGIIVLAVVLLGLGFILGVFAQATNDAPTPGGVEYEDQRFVADVFNGIGETKMMSGGYLVGPIDLDGTVSMSVGTNGTAHTKMISGTCNLSQVTAGSHSATTSEEFYCAVTGAESGDKVFVSLPKGAGPNNGGAGSGSGGFLLNSAFATSSGFIGVSITNLTGAASTSFSQATTSAQYWIVDS